MQHETSAAELTAVHIEPCGASSHVWLRRHIAMVEIDLGDGFSQTMWEADMVDGLVDGFPTEGEIADDFDSWWDRLERQGMSDADRIAEIYAMAERAQAQADYTALMTETEIA